MEKICLRINAIFLLLCEVYFIAESKKNDIKTCLILLLRNNDLERGH